MKKKKGLLDAIKYLLLAIAVGGFFGNLACIWEFLPTITPFANDFIPFLLILTMFSYLSFYFLFMRSGRTLCALAFIPSEYIVGIMSVDFWWGIFESSVDREAIGLTRGGVAMMLIPSTLMFTFIILLMEYIRFRKWLKGKTNSKGEKTTESELMQTEKDGKQK
ncbi:MAG: hypothetical protein J1E62_05765 [Lachnospiraceae bacterium]|nr:hypothetical protein [Lachnospiraceae bacterium]